MLVDNYDKYKIEYVRIDSSEIIGYKPMYPILESKCKYVWVCGDSRYHSFEELDKKVFPHLFNDIDYIGMQIQSNEENDGTIYVDHSVFLSECFISSTCIGLSIYKTTIFDPLKQDESFRKQCDESFRNNYAFAWLGYFYTVYSFAEYRAAFVKVEIYDINKKTKKQVWAKRFFESWCQNVCELVDGLPDIYRNKDRLVSETWEKMNYDYIRNIHKAWVSGGLTKDIYMKYKTNGMLDRLECDERRVRFFACSPKWLVSLYYYVFKVYRKIGKLFNFIDDRYI